MFANFNKTKFKITNQGFSLIELMITVAIIGIIASVAFPAYTSYIAKASRADARAQLMQASQFLQRFYAANDSYSADRASNTVMSQMPANLLQSPASGTKLYDLAMPAGASNTTSQFLIQMVPTTGASMSSDQCGTLTLTSTGVRGCAVNSTACSTTLRDTCWK